MMLVRTYGWETRKLARQKRTWADLAAAVLYALAFVIALSLKKHAGIPPDIPLARQLTRSGVVLPLALLGFPRSSALPSSPRSSPATSSQPRTRTTR
jgi:predicted trehalose synthase